MIIPLGIRYHVMQESALQLHREMLQMLQDKEKTECLLQEDFSMETKRRQLQKSLKRMSGARVLLNDFSMNIYNFNTTQATGSSHPTHSNISIRPAATADSTNNCIDRVE
ncbi:hypothetical protein F7725_016675 [Dissostichus mawsoni]|uniref:GED domain-containing protein n=1 Tax=Dissostichus mawsoni TaxID=36200 RepID=A0A7J5Z296_DISMA|nr:hypothetical protein F7725_016675 [Dissostichus mawsoni]